MVEKALPPLMGLGDLNPRQEDTAEVEAAPALNDAATPSVEATLVLGGESTTTGGLERSVGYTLAGLAAVVLIASFAFRSRTD